MPTIAIAPCSQLRDYEKSLVAAGADIRRIDPRTDQVADVLAWADGVLLTGGSDVDPARYGAPAHRTFTPSEPGRDAFEIALVEASFATRVPLLAICRGIQVLNVARGGTLIQHIPDEVPRPLEHRVATSPVTKAHVVSVEPGSQLARTLPQEAGALALSVNSRHHQAVAALGAELRVTATAADGVIEAVEAPLHPFCVGVQWHPENFHRTGEFSGLFEAFVRSAASPR